jgi:hypothetical protein
MAAERIFRIPLPIRPVCLGDMLETSLWGEKCLQITLSATKGK